MLCNTTMRAALAHVLGIIGVLAAFGVGAAVPKYATESLTAEAKDLTGYYEISATEAGVLYPTSKIDTLLQADSEDHYLVLKFGAAKLAQLASDTTNNLQSGIEWHACPSLGPDKKPFTGDTAKDLNGDGDTTDPGEEAENCSTVTAPSLTRAYRGDQGDSEAVFRLSGTSISIDTYLRIQLSEDLAVKSEPAEHSVDIYIYDDLGAARSAATGTPGATDRVFDDQGVKIFEVANKIKQPGVKPHLATADVANAEGPFLRFVANATGTTVGAGVLATITLEEFPNAGFVKQDGKKATRVLTNAKYEVTSAVAGAFRFGNGADKQGSAFYDSKTKTGGGAPKAFMVSTSASCGNGPLTLTKGTAAINPLAKTDATFAEDADGANATIAVGGATDAVKHTRYFCVLVDKNTILIPTVGNDSAMDGYQITVTPIGIHVGTTHDSKGNVIPKTFTFTGAKVGPTNAGSIKRNGTTVNVAYLSAHEAYNQRLVIVNRGGTVANYWMSAFQTEEGTEVLSSTDIRGSVPANGRLVVRMQDVLDLSGKTRASGVLNLNAPSATIDVMTVQVHPGTGQIDTTLYGPDEG